MHERIDSSNLQYTTLKPKLDLKPTLAAAVNNVTDEREGLIERIFGHRALLYPETPDAPFDPVGRHKKTSFIYRRTAFTEKFRPVPESFGNKKDAYQLGTRWLAKHPGAALSLLTKSGEWALVTFPEPMETDELPPILKRPEKKHVPRRHMEAPTRK